MHSTKSNATPFATTNTIKILLMTIFAATATLSMKAGYDLTANSDIFPAWFVPSFVLVISILIIVSIYFVLQLWKIEQIAHLLTSKQSVFLWIFMVLSFICTTSVHGFYPFRSNIFSVLPGLDPVLKTNYVIAAVGFITCVVLAGIYTCSSNKLPAIIGLMILALLMLIPNDNCANPFNYWWIKTMGASPLMYVPNIYMILFIACGLCGIRPKAVALITISICLSSLMLGMGHRLGILW